MPQKHNDINHGVDPELIRRYLAGELDDKAMHLLEKQALEDPFLADALEGYASYVPDQHIHLADLENRLEKRVAKKSRVVPMLLRWSAAAAILILAAVGLEMLWKKPASVRQDIVKVQEKPDTVVPSAVMDEQGPVVIDNVKPLPKKPAAPVEDKKDSKVETDYAAEEAPAVAMATPAPAPALSRKAQEVEVVDSVKADEPALHKYFSTDAAKEKKRDLSASLSPSKRTIKGRVTLFKSSEPLPGAQIRLGNTTTGAVTDPNGNFTILADSGVALLNVNMIGYESNRIVVASNESNVKIGLTEASSNLQEVVVSGYGRVDDDESPAYQGPTPEGGKREFKSYILKSVRYPITAGGVKGKVRVSFVVKTDGTLTDFKIIKKLHPDCDNEAIRVIMAGPQWKPASDNKDTRVKVEVPFKP